MEKESVEKGKMFKLEDLYEKARFYPMATFDAWPIAEIREECFKKIKEWEVDDSLADWAEKHIRELLAARHETLPRNMLEWYVFKSAGKKTERAVNFCLSLLSGKEDGRPPVSSFGENVISKILAGDLRGQSPEIYRRLTSLKSFLRQLLDKLKPRSFEKSVPTEYLDGDWFCAERALKIIVAYNDFSFLSKIDQLIDLFQAGKIKPRSELFYAQKSHLAAFLEARRLLLKARKEILAGKAE